MTSFADIPPDRLAISSWAFAEAYYRSEFSLLDLSAKAAQHGYQQVEMNDFMLPPPRFSRVVQPLLGLLPQVNPELWRYRRATLQELKRRLAEQQVDCLCWTLNTDFAGPAGTSLAQRLYWRWGVDAAILLKARLLRIILGGPDNGRPANHTIPQLLRFLRATFHRFDGTIVLENHWGVSSDIDVMLAIFHEVREQLSTDEQARFRICLDPENMAERNRPENWAKMVPWTGHVHLKSTPNLELSQLLHNYNYDCYYTIESI